MENQVTVKRLNGSGFWSIWIGGQWIDAAQPTREAAEALAETVRASVKAGK